MTISTKAAALSTAATVARRVMATTLVGRDSELELLAEAIASPPAVAVIEGEAGIGKTRLVAELKTRPELAGRRWLVGGCRKIREPFPLGPVIEAVRALGAETVAHRGVGRDVLVAARLSPVTGALRPLLPELAAWLPLAPEPLDDRAAERHRIFRGLTELLAAVGSVDVKRPVVLVLEDLHWADEQTAEFLTYLLGDPPQGLSVVLTDRGEEARPGVRPITAKLPTSVRRRHVVLGPLGADDTATLALSILDAERLSQGFTDYLWERASGVPFAVEELLTLLSERGTLVQRDGRWERRALEELDVPAGIRDPVLERVAALSEAGRAVVEAAAVLQEPASPEVLIAACRALEPAAWRGLEKALASRLLVERGELVGFRHVLSAQAVYEALTGPHRRDLHRRVANALEGLDTLPLGQFAHHLRHAGRLHEWATVAERAADRAVELDHDDEAVRLLDDVLRHGQLEGVERGRVAVKLGRAAAETFRSSAGLIELLSAVLEQDGELPRSVRGELAFWLAAAVSSAGGDLDQVRGLMTKVVDDLDGRPDLTARAMVALAVAKHPGVPLAEHKAWLERVLKVLPDVDDAGMQVLLLGKVAMTMLCVGDPQWRPVAARIEERTSDTVRDRRVINAYLSVGMMACYVGHYPTARRFLDRALDGADAADSRGLKLRVRSELALLDFCCGYWDGLGDRVDALLAETADVPLARVDVEVTAGLVALAHHDLDAARRYLTDAWPQVEDLAEFHLLAFVAEGLARQAVASADAETVGEVVALVERLLVALESKQVWAPVVRALPGTTQLFIAAGRTPDARALVDRCADELAEMDAPLAPARLRFANGVLDANDERWLEAAGHFLAAAEHYEAMECRYEAAQAREQAAVALTKVGDARAEATMRAALATYRRLGASGDEGRCTRLARSYGIRIPVPHRGGRKGYGQNLSPREAEIAALAAAGHTNKQIAERLFLSPATVGSHLIRAMNKLGVHTRAALSTTALGMTGPSTASSSGKTQSITGTQPHTES